MVKRVLICIAMLVLIGGNAESVDKKAEHDCSWAWVKIASDAAYNIGPAKTGH